MSFRFGFIKPAPPAAWTPAQLSWTNEGFWFTADNYNAGTGLATDQSGNANHFIQGNASRQPTVEANGFATGKNSLNFDGVDDFLGPDGGWALSQFVQAGNFDILVGLNFNGTLPLDTTRPCVCGDDSGVFAQLWATNQTGAGGPLFRTVHRDAGGEDGPIGRTATLPGRHVVRLWHTGGNINLQVDNNASTSTASGNSPNLAVGFRIGTADAIGTGNKNGSFKFAGIIGRKTILTGTDLTNAKTWMGNLMDISV